ncbi:uncharacterized protein LOC116065246 isoform X3 [Sander lucioperca]|uniref:uncharacterized protein LOC116065246 isoform X3 n=1 Tax=Sander lucioperca TaxID=283035 RepID=UPI00125CDF20|nr:uncharacterized protein LOC116065246 isoform X3 [Sander lucioperca]
MNSTITSSQDVLEPVYEDPDAPKPAVPDGSQSEVEAKPVPPPRSRQSQSQCNDNVYSADTTSNTTNAVNSQLGEYPADYKTPRPVRPPPRPPLSKCMTTIKLKAAVDEDYHCISSNSEPTPPAVTPEKIQSPPPPPRPKCRPSPSSFYGPHSTNGLTSESYTDESQQSSHYYVSFMRESPASAASGEQVNPCGTFNPTTDRPAAPPRFRKYPLPCSVSLCETSPLQSTDSTDRPAVPLRLRQSSLPCSVSLCETSPLQTKPPPPSFSPPSPPSKGKALESVYSEIQYPPYLDVLPEDVDKRTKERPAVRYQNDRCSPHQQTPKDKEDLIGMLRWLIRVSKSDSMAPSLYGLTIEEEIRSFNQRAINVRKALRLYNLLMMKRNESLRTIIGEFSSISDGLDKIKKTAKTMGIAGGTTGAVGGVTAVLGIAFAPVTFGTSLIATAVGAGMVASAGGMGAHSAKVNKKIVNKMTVEKLVYEYKGNVVELEHCLGFILSGMNELRRHDIARLQRAGAQPDALKMAHLSQSVFNVNNDRKTSNAHTGGMSSERLLQDFVKEMDQYFTEKDDQKLKKSNRSRFSGRVRLLAKNLADELDHLNRMWEMFS